MFSNKKVKTKQKTEKEDQPIDFAWIIYIGMNKLGFSYEQTGQLYFGLWADLLEAFKRQYNFEIKKGLYEIETEEKRGSLLDL